MNEPDWNFWRDASWVLLREAVALSVSINPYALRIGQGATGKILLGIPEEIEEEFDRRLDLAHRSLGVKLPTLDGYDGAFSKIRLDEFLVWATALKWRLPNGLPRDIQRQPSTPGPKPTKLNMTKRKILDELTSGKRNVEQLKADTLDALVKEYGSSRNTASKARDKAIAQFQSLGEPNSE
ncbi:MAG: hypothetical protein JO001_01860 [Alphaproteobacteria bacterium]|nr:hypothetical protein [Alphaproteobacteria bacterium]